MVVLPFLDIFQSRIDTFPEDVLIQKSPDYPETSPQNTEVVRLFLLSSKFFLIIGFSFTARCKSAANMQISLFVYFHNSHAATCNLLNNG